MPFPAFGDLDNDGDFDMMSGFNHGAFSYFENLTIDINCNVDATTAPVPKCIISSKRDMASLYNSSSEVTSSFFAELRIPPPLAAISSYVRPLIRSTNSYSLVLAKTKWVCESHHAGITSFPVASITSFGSSGQLSIIP
ncbi:MAG: hypothetical protein ACI9FU_001557 [Granulosicoccus sp.]|jgi:hypothetical protein